MCRRSFFADVFSMLVLLILVSPIFVRVGIAQDEELVAGVKIGDWAKYGDIVAVFDSTDPNIKPSAEIIEMENTVEYEITVSDVYYIQISFSRMATLKDGSQNTTKLMIDISTGLGNGSFMFVLADLITPDPVYPYSQEDFPVIFNETIARTYGSATRWVNHLNITENVVVNDNPLQAFYTSISFYWDRKTGILTERSGIYINRTGVDVTSMTRSDKIKDTNLWNMRGGDDADGDKVIEFPYGLLGAVLVTGILIVGVVLWQRKKRLKIRKSRLGRKSRMFSSALVS